MLSTYAPRAIRATDGTRPTAITSPTATTSPTTEPAMPAIDLSQFATVRKGAHVSRTPWIKLRKGTGTALQVSAPLVHALGNPKRVNFLVNEATRQVIIQPDPRGEYSMSHTGSLSCGAVASLMRQYGTQWEPTILPGPLVLIQLDQPIEQ